MRLRSRYLLEGKVALVTGAAGGIGFGTASGLVARGARVVLVDLDLEHVERAAGQLQPGEAIGVAADVTDPGALNSATEAAIASFGRIDVVIANAGVLPPLGTFRSTPAERFERVLDINMNGVQRTVRAVLPEILQNRGHIVVVSSINAWRNSPGRASYGISKAAVEQFGRSLRTELAPYGVGVSVAYFGPIDTPMIANANVGAPANLAPTRVPRGLRKLTPSTVAAAAVIDGIERRQSRIFCPASWRFQSALRGVDAPITDLLAAHQPSVRARIRSLDGDSTTSEHD